MEGSFEIPNESGATPGNPQNDACCEQEAKLPRTELDSVLVNRENALRTPPKQKLPGPDGNRTLVE